MRENGKHSFARGTLDTLDGEAAEPKSGIMGVARETAAATTRGFVTQLEANGEEESRNELNERFAITAQLQVGRFIVKIHDNGTDETSCG